MGEVRIAKVYRCRSLSDTTTITYQSGFDEQSNIYLRIIESTRGGTCSDEWIPWEKIKDLFGRDNTIITKDIKGLYRQTDNNTPGFMIAALRDRKLIENKSEHSYIGLDDTDFIRSTKQHIQEKMDNDKIDTSTLLGHPKKK